MAFPEPHFTTGRRNMKGWMHTHWIMAAVISWTFPVVANAPGIGGGPSFAFFAIMMGLHFLFAWKVIPETKEKSLENIQKEISARRK
jgi:Na+/proline symporter